MKEYTIGDPAYLDLLGHILPCKVIAIGDLLTVELTETRGTYEKGETLEYRPSGVIPKELLILDGDKYKAKESYRWV